MKSHLLFVTGLILFSFTTNAQFNSGSFFVSGKSALTFDSSKSKWETTESSPDRSRKLTSLTFSSSGGYFIENRLAVGGFADYSLNKDIGDFISQRSCNLLIGPMVRYFFSYNIGGVIPFAEADAGIGRGKSKYKFGSIGINDDKFSIFRVSAGAGVNYFLNDHIALEGLLKYYSMTQKNKEENNDFTYIYSGILLRFGVTIFLDRI